MARKKKLEWKTVQGTKHETWTCTTKENVNAVIIRKDDDYIYNVTNNGKIVASGVSKGFMSASGNAELRIRSALNEDLGV